MNYQVQLNNGQVITLKEANIDAEAFTDTLNNREINFINIAGAIVSKHIITAIIPITDVAD